MSVISSALSGLQLAQTQFAKSASKITSATHITSSDRLVLQPNTSGDTPINGSITSQTPTAFSANSVEGTLVQDVISLDLASQAYKANITVLKTWDDMSLELLDK